ncbi:hypothetical protein [Parapedobacter sp. DT-150]|uniref:hypothetical protein n=1 Tax=Parapedobacter sp. DT-150 TaxID=3396162 RepID=UPI003F1E05FF
MKTTMKQPKKRYDSHMEHYLVPTALFLLNVSAVHVIYAYSNAAGGQGWWLLSLTVALAALGSAVWIKNRIYLWCSMAYYLLLFIYCCL